MGILKKIKLKNLKFKVLLALILAGLILRLYLATLPGFKIDIDSFFAWAIRLADLGLPNFYSNDVFTDYTPGYLYILYLIGQIKNIFSLDSNQFYLVLKLPAILAEVAIGAFVFLIAKQKYSLKMSILFSSLIFFNFGLIFNSSIWGQVDSFLTLFMTLSIYFLTQKKYLHSSFFLGLSFLVKPQTIALFPFFLFFIFKKHDLKISGQLFFPAAIVTFILALPFFLTDPVFGLFKRILETAQQYPYTSLYAFNFWGIVGVWLKDSDQWFYSLSYQTWGNLFFLLFWIITSFYYFRKNIPLFSLAALATLAFYFLPTRAHERYLYPALVFLLLAALELKSTFLLICQALLSISYLLNLYYVYIYYNHFYLHEEVAFLNLSVYNQVEPNIKLLSGFNTILFIVITVYLLSKKYAKNNP